MKIGVTLPSVACRSVSNLEARATTSFHCLNQITDWSMIMKTLKAFWKEEDGLSAVEYAVVGAVLIAALVGAFQSLGTRVSGKVGNIAT